MRRTAGSVERRRRFWIARLLGRLGCDFGGAPLELANPLLQFPDAEPAATALFASLERRMLRSESEQRPRMAGGERAALDHLLHLHQEGKHAQKIRDRRPILPHRLGDLLLRQLEFFDQPPIAAGLFDRVEVRALEIFDERQHQHRAVVEVANDRRDLRPAEVGRGAEASLAGDQLERVALSADGYRLKQSARLERRLELRQLRRIEFATRLKRVRANRDRAIRWRSLAGAAAECGRSPGSAPRVLDRGAAASRCSLDAPHKFFCDIDIRLRADRCDVVQNDRLSEARRLGQTDVSRNHGLENLAPEVLAGLGRNLAREIESASYIVSSTPSIASSGFTLR